MALTPEQMLSWIEDSIRTLPSVEVFRAGTDESAAWVGQAQAIMTAASGRSAADFRVAAGHLQFEIIEVKKLRAEMLRALQTARHTITLQIGGPVGVAVSKGAVHDYFEAVRKVIELANEELFFVDPFLDADFVTRYLVHVRDGVRIQLLARENPVRLVAAVEMFTKQHGTPIEVRTSEGMHDRFVFVDNREGYQSGASFSGGGLKATTALNRVLDTFAPILDTYRQMWGAGVRRFVSPKAWWVAIRKNCPTSDTTAQAMTITAWIYHN